MKPVPEEDFDHAVETVVSNLSGIASLYPSQLEVLRSLVVEQDNLFVTQPTNSGKTIPVVILPEVLKELNSMGHEFPPVPRVLFITALNSIQISLVESITSLGIGCAAVTRDNVDQVLSSEVSVLLVGPEMMKVPSVTKSLLKFRTTFVLKCLDEAHLSRYFCLIGWLVQLCHTQGYGFSLNAKNILFCKIISKKHLFC